MKENKIQQEELQTVGEMLRNARLKQGKTLSEVADELCIRKVYLTAIEEMDYVNIPPLPYGAGFIRSYAKYLGLNGDRIISSYRQYITEEKNEKSATNQENIETSKPHFKHIFFGLCGLAALFIAWSVMPFSEPVEEFREDATSIIPEPVIVDEEAGEELMSKLRQEDEKDGTVSDYIEATDKIEQGNINADEDTAANEADSQNVFKIVVNAPTWLELRQGEKTLITGNVYDKGYEYVVPSEKGLRVTVGRPHNVSFLVGDKPLDVVSVMKRKSVSLDEFLPIQE